MRERSRFCRQVWYAMLVLSAVSTRNHHIENPDSLSDSASILLNYKETKLSSSNILFGKQNGAGWCRLPRVLLWCGGISKYQWSERRGCMLYLWWRHKHAECLATNGPFWSFTVQPKLANCESPCEMFLQIYSRMEPYMIFRIEFRETVKLI